MGHEGNIMLYGRPVCDDIATPENAEVVCRQLGYLGGYITTNSFFGRVSSDFIMDEVNCNGTEEYIWRCPHDTQENCGGSEGMGVVCSNEEPGSGSGSADFRPESRAGKKRPKRKISKSPNRNFCVKTLLFAQL